MSRHIRLVLAPSEGALIRVLGTVERRGYSLHKLHVEKTADDCIRVSMQVESDRDANVLCRQLERLFDVQTVSLETEPPFIETPRFQATWL
jgi:acetolactate synthase II small subunit